MPTTPAWSAPQNGLPGNLDATNASAQVNQPLGSHGITPVYTGAQVLTPNGNQSFEWISPGNGTDLDQPFTLSGTSVGRVSVPVQAVGAGANLLVSLYPDNGSGAPNVSSPALASTMVPAKLIATLTAPNGLDAGGPMATASYSTMYCTAPVTTHTWAFAAGGPGGISAQSAFTTSGNYAIYIGGTDGVTLTDVAGVVTAQYNGGGSLSLPVPQPSMPQPVQLGAMCAGTNIVVYAGGNPSPIGAAYVANTYTASWDANTGTIGSWSSQTPLPVGIAAMGSAIWNDSIVYVVNGNTDSTFVAPLVASCYYATLTNGQIGAWRVGTPPPLATLLPNVSVIGNWLVVCGGDIMVGGGTPVSNVYYAPINADGSIGAWSTGPSLPVSIAPNSSGWDMMLLDDAVVFLGGHNGVAGFTSAMQILMFDEHGPADRWVSTTWVRSSAMEVSAFPQGDGSIDVVSFNLGSGYYEFTSMVPVPVMSVPLPATGLSNGSTYHVVLQQCQNGSAGDYLNLGLLGGTALPLAALSSSRHSGSWATYAAGMSVPMAVFDASAAGDQLHAVCDVNGYGVSQSWSTLLYDSRHLLVGVADVTLNPNVPLNSNPTFTSGVSPWTVTGGTFVQSAAQTHGGFPFSGLLTPNGVAASAFASSELFPVQQGGGPFYGASSWYLADGWFYSTPGTTNFSFSVAWYDRLGTLLSTSSSTIALAAATWTHVQNYVEAPAGAAQAQLVPTESGTPANTKLLYVSDAYLIQSWECVGSFCSAATVNYGAAPWPPTGVTQLL